MARLWPTAPKSTSWCETTPGRRSEWMRTPPDPAAPRAPGSTCEAVWSAGQASPPAIWRAFPRRSAVVSAVPDGASSLPSWWISTISTPSMNGAANSANRIMRTAPMAKLEAMTQFADEPSNRDRSSPRTPSSMPVVPTTAWTAWAAHHRMCSTAAPATVKSTATCAPERSSSSTSLATCSPAASAPVTWRRSIPASAGSTAATSSSSRSSATARHTSRPIRPPAPSTPTRITRRPYRRADEPGAPRRPGHDRRSRAVRVEGTDHRQGPRLRRQSGRHRRHVLDRDGVHLGQDLVDVEDLSVQQQARPDPAHACSRVLERQERLGPEMSLGHCELPRSDTGLSHAVELTVDEGQHFPHVFGRRPHAHGQGPDLLVMDPFGPDRIGEAAALPYLLEQATRDPTS